MCLEVNILSVIPILISRGEKNCSVVGVKYFIPQRVVSLIFVIILIITQEMGGLAPIIRLVILFKLAIPPLQSWITRILSELNYICIWVLFTVQKVIPLVVLSQLGLEWNLIILSGILIIFFLITINRILASISLLLFVSSMVNTL